MKLIDHSSHQPSRLDFLAALEVLKKELTGRPAAAASTQKVEDQATCSRKQAAVQKKQTPCPRRQSPVGAKKQNPPVSINEIMKSESII